jgi:hypothetical protein
MTKLLTIVLVGILALPLLSRGSVTVPTRRDINISRSLARNRSSYAHLARAGAQASRSRRSKAVASKAYTRHDEPAVVILYGGQPWSWM